VNDPNLLPALASVVFIRIAEYTRRQVAEQARLRSQLESAVATSIVDVPENCRIVLDAPDGMGIAILHNPEAALNVAERCVGVAAVGIPLSVGINHGAIQLSPDESGHPGLAGDAIGVAASIADFAGTQKVTASRAFADALSQSNPQRARSLKRVSTYTDRQLRTHELLVPKPGTLARQRRVLSIICGVLIAGLIGSAVAIRVPQLDSGYSTESIWTTIGNRSRVLWRHYYPADGSR